MTDVEYMIECMTKDLVILLMERRHMDIEDAFDTLYNSDTFKKLQDVRSGLYFQSPLYVYDFLEKEIETGTLAWLQGINLRDDLFWRIMHIFATI